MTSSRNLPNLSPPQRCARFSHMLLPLAARLSLLSSPAALHGNALVASWPKQIFLKPFCPVVVGSLKQGVSGSNISLQTLPLLPLFPSLLLCCWYTSLHIFPPHTTITLNVSQKKPRRNDDQDSAHVEYQDGMKTGNYGVCSSTHAYTLSAQLHTRAKLASTTTTHTHTHTHRAVVDLAKACTAYWSCTGTQTVTQLPRALIPH